MGGTLPADTVTRMLTVLLRCTRTVAPLLLLAAVVLLAYGRWTTAAASSATFAKAVSHLTWPRGTQEQSTLPAAWESTARGFACLDLAPCPPPPATALVPPGRPRALLTTMTRHLDVSSSVMHKLTDGRWQWTGQYITSGATTQLRITLTPTSSGRWQVVIDAGL